MELRIEEMNKDKLKISLIRSNGEEFKYFYEPKQTGNKKILILVADLLKQAQADKTEIKRIGVSSEGGTFSSLRERILVANALAYALNVPVYSLEGHRTVKADGIEMVEPVYSKEPNIGKSKKVL